MDTELLRVEGALVANGKAPARWRRPLLLLALLSAQTWAALGCTGTLGEGGRGDKGDPGKEDPEVMPGTGGRPGPGPGPDPMVDSPAPVACKADQVAISPLRRLTKVEYDNTVRDLLGVALPLAKDFSE